MTTTADHDTIRTQRSDPRGDLVVTFTPYLPLPTQVWHFVSLMSAIEFLSDQGMSLAAAQQLIATGHLESTQPGADGPDVWRFTSPADPDPDEQDGTDYDADQGESDEPYPAPVVASAERTAALSHRVAVVTSVLLAIVAQVAIFTGHPLTGHLHTLALLDTAWLGLCCLGRALDYVPEGGEPS